jgi:hypothetical protein
MDKKMATKAKKYPKAPKAKASLEVWEKHLEKCKEVDTFNKNVEAERKKKADAIKKVKALKKK